MFFHHRLIVDFTPEITVTTRPEPISPTFPKIYMVIRKIKISVLNKKFKDFGDIAEGEDFYKILAYFSLLYPNNSDHRSLPPPTF
jgi:hypothetical protein